MMAIPLHCLLRVCSKQRTLCAPSTKIWRTRWHWYHTSNQTVSQEQSNQHILDFRSDTVTQPTQGMREAMAGATVGDDVMGEDPTVNELQKRCADLFGKEDTLFVPSGTMGNLISVLVHCEGRGLEAVLGDLSHIFYFEQGGLSQFGSVMASLIPNNPNGTFDINVLKKRIRTNHNDYHQPITRLVCLENTHNYCGGKVLPLSFMEQVYSTAKERDVYVHLDGARVMNAATVLNVPVSSILQYTDSVNMCFSKGLGAPVGSIIGGSKDFITRAKRVRKALGGGMRQAGVLAAAAIYSLDHVVPLLANDHLHAKMFAEGIMNADQRVLSIDLKGVHTNIIFVNIIKDDVTGPVLQKRLAQVTDQEKDTLGDCVTVKCQVWGEKLLRFVVHCNLSRSDMKRAMKKIIYVLTKLS